MASDTTGMKSCHICFATFQTPKTLRRHLASHSEEKPYQCSFCKSRFKRSDILRKHFNSCVVRQANGEEVPPSSRGRSRKACDRCVKMRKGCDEKQPCSLCVGSGQVCSYERVGKRDQSQDQGGSDAPFELDESNESYQQDLKAVKTEPTDKSEDLSHLQQPSLRSISRCGIDASASTTGIPWRLSTTEKRFDFLLHVTGSSGLKTTFNFRRKRGLKYGVEHEDTSFMPVASPQSKETTQAPHKIVDIQNRGIGLESQAIEDPLGSKAQELWLMFRALCPELRHVDDSSPQPGIDTDVEVSSQLRISKNSLTCSGMNGTHMCHSSIGQHSIP